MKEVFQFRQNELQVANDYARILESKLVPEFHTKVLQTMGKREFASNDNLREIPAEIMAFLLRKPEFSTSGHRDFFSPEEAKADFEQRIALAKAHTQSRISSLQIVS